MSISDFNNDSPKDVTWETPEASQKPSEPNTDTKTSEPVSTPSESPATSTESTSPAVSQTSVTNAAPSVDDILDRAMGRIGNIGETSKFKFMVIGPPGQGKSSLVGSADDLLVYDFEDGLISAMGSPHGVGQNSQALPYQNMDEFRAIVGALMNGDERLARYKVFGIDTLSDLHKRDLAEITERDWRNQPSRNRYVPETEQYTEVNERIVRVVRALRDLPIDIVITAHSKTVEPKVGPAKTYADFSESLSNKIMAMMDLVGYLQFKNVDDVMVPVIRFQTEGTIHCKSRVPMPAEVINPSYAEIRRLYMEGSKSVRNK